jgi:hypothetical protein
MLGIVRGKYSRRFNMIQQSIRSEFLNECNLAFKFLINDFGFSEPILEEGKNTLSVYYFKREIAIEVDLDQRDEVASIRIVHLENGQVPDVWRMNKKGEIVKEYYTALLEYHGIRDYNFEKPPPLDNISKREKNIRDILFAGAYWLKKYGQDILEGSSKIFEGYNEPGDRF